MALTPERAAATSARTAASSGKDHVAGSAGPPRGLVASKMALRTSFARTLVEALDRAQAAFLAVLDRATIADVIGNDEDLRSLLGLEAA